MSLINAKIHEGARKRRKQGVANVPPIVRPDDIDVDEVEDQDAAPLPFRCVFPDCPSAQIMFPGWVSKQLLITYINNVHMASGCLPTEQMSSIPFRSRMFLLTLS